MSTTPTGPTRPTPVRDWLLRAWDLGLGAALSGLVRGLISRIPFQRGHGPSGGDVGPGKPGGIGR